LNSIPGGFSECPLAILEVGVLEVKRTFVVKKAAVRKLAVDEDMLL
jgi:hypothetical protein